MLGSWEMKLCLDSTLILSHWRTAFISNCSSLAFCFCDLTPYFIENYLLVQKGLVQKCLCLVSITHNLDNGVESIIAGRTCLTSILRCPFMLLSDQ